jgi:hypothetical protein
MVLTHLKLNQVCESKERYWKFAFEFIAVQVKEFCTAGDQKTGTTIRFD